MAFYFTGILSRSVIVAVLVVLVAAAPSPVDLHIEHTGVPFPSWSSPVYSNATPYNQNPQLTRATHLAPRFHRILRYGKDISSKSQTAIFVAGRSADDEDRGKQGASVLSALNPRNGEIVWRMVRNDTDPMHSMHFASDVVFTISGQNQPVGSMHHALSGQLLWTNSIPSAKDAQHTGLIDAALLPPAFDVSDRVAIAAAAPDVIVMDRSGSVVRFAGVNGAINWRTQSSEEKAETNLPIKLHSTPAHTYVVSLISHQSSLKVFSSKLTYSLRVTVLSSSNGALLSSFDIPNSKVQMESATSRDNTAGNVVVLGDDANPSRGIKPQLVWLQSDGTVHSLILPAPKEQTDITIESASVHIVKTKVASHYRALSEVATLSHRGIIMVITDDHKSEALRISHSSQELMSFWHFEEDAKDAIYSGSIDRQDKGYVNRMYFGNSQRLLNFHVLWVDAHDGEGQVTGFSFQWDHDLNGDVIAAPFEASQVSEFQLVTRGGLVTSSSSIRMIQEDRHQWIREEGLSHTTASVLIDLPESRVASGQHASGLDAKMLLDGEGYIHRLERHLIALQNLPALTFTSIWKTIQDIPAMSVESFGLQGLKKKDKPVVAEGDKKKPMATTTAARSYGAAPLGGVGAQKVFRGGSRPAPKGVPQFKSKQVKGPLQDQGPPPPSALAPRLANETIARTLVRDSFGFRKLIVATSKKGKIYAIDSQTGAHLWEKSLVGFGSGEGKEVPKVHIKLLALVRSVGGSGVDVSSSLQQQASEESTHLDTSQLEYGALLSVVAEVEELGVTITRMWEIDPLTGAFPGGSDAQTGLALFPGRAKDAFLLPIEDERTGQIATVIVDRKDKLYIWPSTESVANRFANISSSFFYTIKEEMQKKDGTSQSILAGYTPSTSTGEVKGERVWQLPIAGDADITSITRSNQDVVASQGKVLGSRKTMYKYLSPHTFVVTTKSVTTRSARAIVVDGITGRVLHEVTLDEGNLVLNNEDGSNKEIQVMFTENWITIAFEVDVLADDPLAKYKGAHRQTRLISIELYELQGKDETWKWKGKTSSFARSQVGPYSSAIQAFSQVYVLPSAIHGLAASRTKYGITSKALLVANNRGKILTLPRRLLDPRRPVGRKPNKEELEEGLMTFDPYLVEHSKWYAGGGKSIPLASHMKTKASLLESLSVLFVYGSLDWWVTRVAPSGTFDLLSDKFNKPQLLLTIVVLSAGLFITKPMVAGKTLKSRW